MALALALPGPVPPGPALARGGRATALLVALAVVATVFNDILPLAPVGEMSKDAFVYALPVLALALLRRPGAVEAPGLLLLLGLGLLGAMLLGVAANYGEIATASFKGRSGMGRVVTQGMAVCMGLFVALLFYNAAVQGHLGAVARGARWALLTMGAVGLLEVGSWYGLPGPTQAYEALSVVIHAETNAYYPTRLRATAFEASWAAVMLTFVFPFALAGARGRAMPLYLGLTLLLMLLAQSRTAMLVIGSQLVLLLAVVLRGRIDLLVHGLAAACLGLMALLAAPGLGGEVGARISNVVEYGSMDGPIDESGGDENVSNITRLAAIRAGLEMFRERPLLGVGLGQYGFNYPGAIRAEDLRSWEVRGYVTGADVELGWPPAYSIHVRLLAETGLGGYLLWLLLVLVPLLRSLRHADDATFVGRMHLAAAMTLGGWLLLGASIDSFRFFGGWIALGVALSLPAPGRALRARGSPAG